MVRRHRLEVAYLLGSLLLLAASLHPPTAYGAAGDPPSGSPAGAVYQLPLEQGRSDAAPKGSGGTGAGAGGASTGTSSESAGGGTSQPAETGSLYRSENNFGSSSQVPGVAATGGAGDANGSGAGAGGASAGAGGTAGGGAGAGGAAIAGGAVAAETADTGNTSLTAGAILLGAIALLAVAVGILSRRRAGT